MCSKNCMLLLFYASLTCTCMFTMSVTTRTLSEWDVLSSPDTTLTGLTDTLVALHAKTILISWLAYFIFAASSVPLLMAMRSVFVRPAPGEVVRPQMILDDRPIVVGAK